MILFQRYGWYLLSLVLIFTLSMMQYQFFSVIDLPATRFTVQDSQRLHLLLTDKKAFQNSLYDYLSRESPDEKTLRFLAHLAKHHNDTQAMNIIGSHFRTF